MTYNTLRDQLSSLDFDLHGFVSRMDNETWAVHYWNEDCFNLEQILEGSCEEF